MTVTDPAFGDYEEDDAFDTAEADPERVAIFLQRLRREADLGRRFDRRDWDDLDDGERAKLIAITTRLIGWWRRQGLR